MAWFCVTVTTAELQGSLDCSRCPLNSHLSCIKGSQGKGLLDQHI